MWSSSDKELIYRVRCTNGNTALMGTWREFLLNKEYLCVNISLSDAFILHQTISHPL